MRNHEQPPVRNGSVYCAPWCGGGCTWAAFQKATRDAEALAKELGAGWIPYVWENMGWYYKVSRGVIDIHPNIRRGKIGSYSCFVQTSPQFVGDGKTALASLRDAGKKFGAVVDALRASLSFVQLTFGTTGKKKLPGKAL